MPTITAKYGAQIFYKGDTVARLRLETATTSTPRRDDVSTSEAPPARA